MIRHAVLGLATVAAVAAAQAQAQTPASGDAALFGAREKVAQASLSPDGKSVAFITAGPGRSSMLMIGSPDTELKPVLAATGEPEELRRCQWSTNTRLVCRIALIVDAGNGPGWFTRMVSVNADGSNLKRLSAAESARALGVAQNGGQIIDWLSEAGSGKVLMTRAFVPEETTGTRMANERTGLGVDRVDTTSLARVTVEPPNSWAIEYITDGHGQLRIRGLRLVDGSGYHRDAIGYQYRAADGREWKALSQFSVATGAGFNPYAVDRTLDVAYGFDKLDGRQALFKLALDGSAKRELVLARPDVDVDGLLRIGRQGRVVGASFATDRREFAFFDPELKALAARLSKALPRQPMMNFVDASDDESKLLIWAGSDVDPGRYYLYDKKTRQLVQLLEKRPGLAEQGLSPVKAITYPAADGTAIPAYLTLPPTGDGNGLPAIVLPHGGPAARDEWGFDWLAQFFARRGYAVLQPNFRGSAGYGDAWYQKNGFQSWRTAIGDVADGGRWLVKQGIARDDRLAVLGWSYGGYAALQTAVVAPTLFKAVVAVAPVTDLAALRTEARNFTSGAQVDAFIGRGAHVREGSPAQNAAAIKAPVLMFHGDQDLNVGVAQSRLMAGRLRAAGAKPQLVEYKGLDHQLDDSKARADLLAKADAFIRAAMGM